MALDVSGEFYSAADVEWQQNSPLEAAASGQDSTLLSSNGVPREEQLFFGFLGFKA